MVDRKVESIVTGVLNAVVEQPFGSYPGHLAGCYNDGPGALMPVVRQSDYEANVQESIYGVNDWNEYLENLKKKNGADFLDRLRLKDPMYSEPVPSGYATLGGSER